METIQAIIKKLHAANEHAPWIEELKEDKRKGVQKALLQWDKKIKKEQFIRERYTEKIAFDESYKPFPKALLAGVDEAGRGPLAGPVVCAAVILPEDSTALFGLDDSKRISKQHREQLAAKIKDVAVAYSVHIQPARVIDEINIYQATRASMEEAVASLSCKPEIVLVDAMNINADCPAVSIIKGDAQSLAIAAASILAKTARDALMDKLHEQYPVYQFNKNAGYGTADHLQALQTHGPIEQHRRTFEPVKSIVSEKEDLL